mgnify:CR=1 FL=1
MKMNTTVKSVAMGVAAGTATYMLSNMKHRKVKTMKKKAEHAMKAVGSAVSDLTMLMK